MKIFSLNFKIIILLEKPDNAHPARLLFKGTTYVIVVIVVLVRGSAPKFKI